MPGVPNEPVEFVPAPGEATAAASTRALLPVGLAGAFVIIVWLAAGLALWHERSRALQDGEDAAGTLAQVLDEQTARTFQAVDLTLIGVIDALHHATALPDHDPAFEDTLRQKLKAMPYVRALFVIGADGFITQDTDHPFTPHVTLADRPYFKAHQNDPELGLHIA